MPALSCLTRLPCCSGIICVQRQHDGLFCLKYTSAPWHCLGQVVEQVDHCDYVGPLFAANDSGKATLLDRALSSKMCNKGSIRSHFLEAYACQAGRWSPLSRVPRGDVFQTTLFKHRLIEQAAPIGLSLE